MKLYKKVEWRDANNLAFYKEPEEATLDDLKQAAKEMGYAVVPVEPTEAMLDAADEHFDSSVRLVYKAMLKASEAADE